MSSSATAEILVEVTRGEMTESIHRGHMAVVDFRRHTIAFTGNPDYYTYARSTAKPIQAIPLIEAGGLERYALTPAELALCCASHNGESAHAETALALLRKAGFDESALSCGVHEPFYKPAAEAIKQSGLTVTPLHNNCSGKHAGMLALSALMQAPTQQYTASAHPVQIKMLQTVADMCGVPTESIGLGTDGCGVPVFALPLAALAYGYARLGNPEELPRPRADACRQIIGAIRTAPYYVAGTGRYDTRLIEVTGGRIVGKMGAEGVYALTVPQEGIGLALKIEDGSERALYPAATEALLQLGLLKSSEAEQLEPFHRPAVTNRRGETVGAILPVFRLQRE
ncbi:asparaginase [Paenibacillus allorhizosphaerae]|uniref:Asparaginase n=1 Tax=Paenibacillus allorhizosphaerae TaxID=2849866 RepID=A0ABN7TGA4_9BACL|nr:asparaginase [Paenibacillus allorhizosphaerae]CAG7622741.1 hypothetical protein PAECIP111802_00863 [Paenibacillus allorhizosphaerae]